MLDQSLEVHPANIRLQTLPSPIDAAECSRYIPGCSESSERKSSTIHQPIGKALRSSDTCLRPSHIRFDLITPRSGWYMVIHPPLLRRCISLPCSPALQRHCQTHMFPFIVYSTTIFARSNPRGECSRITEFSTESLLAIKTCEKLHVPPYHNPSTIME